MTETLTAADSTAAESIAAQPSVADPSADQATLPPLLLAMPGNEVLADALARALGGEVGTVEVHQFPDGETLVRIGTPVRGRSVLLFATLARPDDKLLPLVFMAATARDLGAARVGLVAPYLAYMRQDRRFREGEGVTSRYFAHIVSDAVDWLVTVDPHLHRHESLADIYTIPGVAVRAAPAISAWIGTEIPRPLLVGPDSESVQWVRAVAEGAGVPALVLEKVRRGDREVEVSVPEVERWRDRTPVLVDDIISTARTMIETVSHLRRAGLAPPVCVGVHAVFAGRAYEDLIAAGASRVVTCNTIPHPSNAIDLSEQLARGIRSALATNGVRSESSARWSVKGRTRQPSPMDGGSLQ